MKIISIAGVALLLLAVAKGISPDYFGFLPLGGSSVSEMGIVFGLAVAAATVHEIWRSNND